MNESTSKQFVLLERPLGVPSESTFGLEKIRVPNTIENNELRLHGLYYSVDPYMRGRMNAENPYILPFKLNQPIEGKVIARVTESKSTRFKSGDLVMGQLPWATDMVVPELAIQKLNLNHSMASEYLGVLGMPGHAAYFGLLKIAQTELMSILTTSEGPFQKSLLET